MSHRSVNRASAPPPGPLRSLEFPTIERFVLSNGLPVLFARTEGLPVATFSLVTPAGAARERPERAGLARLTAALLESGTDELDATGVAERLEELGVQLHAGTAWEVAHLDVTVLADRAAPAAALAATLITRPAFPQFEVDRLRNEQLAGILQRRADPRSLANEMASRFLFAEDSPFSRPLNGFHSTVSTIERADVVDFHARTVSPDGSGLVVAANLDSREVRDICESAFGGWNGPPLLPSRPPVSPRSVETQVVLVERPGAVQSEIRVGHLGVARDNPDYFAILVMNTILGGAFSSRLNLNLREKHGFTYGASSSFVMRRQPGPFLVTTAVQTDVTAQAITEIIGELRAMRTEPVTDAEIEDARQYVAGTFPLRLQTTDGVASRLAELFIHDLPDSYLQDFATRVLAVTIDDVRAAAERYLAPDRLTVLAVGDPASLAVQLDRLGLGSVQHVRVEDLP